jgi:hypothetical protein
MKTIKFGCYRRKIKGKSPETVWMFFPKGTWDEQKYTLKEALKKYPPEEYKWLYIG